MFDPDPARRPRVYGMDPGVDFPAALVSGLRAAYAGKPPQDLARVRLIVNTRRMARRIRTLFDEGPPLLLPRIGLVTDLTNLAGPTDVPAAVPPLRRRLEISQLVAGLLEREPGLAPRAALFDLADSLAALMDEMHGEGVSPDAIRALDVSDQSGHWARALRFLDIVQHYFDLAGGPPDTETRQRLIVEDLTTRWQDAPPQEPVILAGSTGSRGTTMRLMQAVAALPRGAIVLPGFDFDMPPPAWDDVSDPLTAEDHPQYRFRVLMDRLGIESSDIRRWPRVAPPHPARNAVVSLALRPAPVTDQWLTEGPALRDIGDAMAGITLIEAPSMRDEALSIAMRLRQAADDGRTAALITPDRMLSRQVTAALDRWKILPDDSAGMPLHLSPPGRFLRHVAALFQANLTAEALLTLLLHPLTHSESGRGPHLMHARALELYIRRHGVPFPDSDALRTWAEIQSDPAAAHWAEWVIACFMDQATPKNAPLADRLAAHIALAERIARGPDGTASGALWANKAGEAARAAIDALIAEADAGGAMSATDYTDMIGAILARQEVRDRDAPHPRILIWGTLEARVQGAEILILGGLNEGSWPEMPPADPWLNRKMRHDAGLLVPERRIGLSAHDFQQAVAAPEVWLTRSVRSDDAETVASRWLNRLGNLLHGLPDQGGQQALADMRARGNVWLARARQMETPGETPAAPRPSPRPPVAARPRQLSVTAIKRLIRDPYAIYARHTLRLKPLDPLMRAPDALLRGIITHSVFEAFMREVRETSHALTAARLMEISDTVLAQNVPWPDIRTLWKARLARASERFITDESRRQTQAQPADFEVGGAAVIRDIGFTLTAQADRIDRTADGALHIYDYKTGKPPSKPQQQHFDKQLLLEAAIAEFGGFHGIDPGPVTHAAYIGLGSDQGEYPAPLEEEPVITVWENFDKLIRAYFSPKQGYTARRAMFRDTDHSDYDQLARFGEWDVTTPPTPEDLP
ncbi:double-strand break repair protein AddB [Sediminimonas qiaohouensis]|uniref:double-strand break repair protein AddB n=1 Tax=Sediminimonas qiaohouensis TaxID=552061 RepID=UPI0003FAAFBD|nr:double-strand break repair protein AddB [Sediminimonas qiaohouensis]